MRAQIKLSNIFANIFSCDCIIRFMQITEDSLLRRVHTMKVMHIGSELIRIVCVHTECALTAICIECTFGQSTSIGSLKANCIIMRTNAGVIRIFTRD